MNVSENITYVSGPSSEKRKTDKFNHMIDKMRLSGLEKNFPHQIWPEERVALARPVLLTAAPSSVSPLLFPRPSCQGKIKLHLLRIREEDHVPIVFTHDVEEAFI